MRSSQHSSKRSRGRSRGRHSGGSSSSGGGNPINRVYESNGPDVKVRGTAQTVADKYLQLGRDAQASGDIVLAEYFYQHAEHYLRILAAAQAYNQQYQQQQQQFRRPGEETFDEDEGDDEGEVGDGQTFERPQYSQEQQPAPESVDRSAGEAREEPQQGRSRDGGESQQHSRSRDSGRDRNSRYRSGPDNRRENEDRNRQQSRNDAPPPPRSEQPAPPVNESEGGSGAGPAGESWDGPQPSFLKRSTNGSGPSRARPERKPRRETPETDETQQKAPTEETPVK
jgi:hypothetical protein